MLHAAMICFYGVLLTSLDDKHQFGEYVLKGKTLSRLVAMLGLIAINFLAISRTSLRVVLIYMSGFLLYAAMAAASVTWSPLPVHSAKQVISFFVMLLFSITIARLCDTSRHASIVLFHLVVILCIRCLSMLMARVALGDWVIARGTSGQLWHSTDVADTAGVGIMIIMTCFFFSNFKWAKALMLPMMALLVPVALIAHNRFSTALTPLMLMLIILVAVKRKFLFWCALIGCMTVPVMLVFDAQIDVTGKATAVMGKFLDREGAAELSSYGGRDELWAIVWELHQWDPWKGHGFMVTSPHGEFFVWHEYGNWDAHNLMLHLLASTGRIGFFIFMTSLLVPAYLIFRNLFTEHRGVAYTAIFAFTWLFLWGFMNVSFGGYINTSQIAFYALLGLVIGILKKRPRPPADSEDSESEKSSTRSSNSIDPERIAHEND